MAKFVNGILGGFSGKVGTVIGACWKGIDYMRALATSITNPRTPAQLEQRAKFSLVIAFLRPLTAFLRIGFRSAALKMSAFNAAMAYNVKNAVSGIYPDYSLDYTKVRVTQGNLTGALNPLAESVVAGTVAFTWEDNSIGGNAVADDKVVLLAYNPAKGQAVSAIGNMTRADEAQTLDLPDSFSGDHVECYISFTDASESAISDSLYVGRILVA